MLRWNNSNKQQQKTKLFRLFALSLSLLHTHTRARSRSWRCQLTELKLLHCGDNNNNNTTLEGRACRWFYLSLCLYRVSIARDSASTQAASHRARRSHSLTPSTPRTRAHNPPCCSSCLSDTMGKGGSKEKKKGGSSKSDEPAPKDTKAAASTSAPANTHASTTPTAAAATATPAAASAGKAAATEEEDDPWDAPCVFSKDKKAVGVEDFDLMAVIGKGSFGKVRGEPAIHPRIHASIVRLVVAVVALVVWWRKLRSTARMFVWLVGAGVGGSAPVPGRPRTHTHHNTTPAVGLYSWRSALTPVPLLGHRSCKCARRTMARSTP